MIEFTVYGVSLPKGSSRAFVPKGWTRPVITSATKGLKGWEQKIAAAAQTVASGVLLTGPLSLGVTFYLPRPKSLRRTYTDHTKRPDLDKLIRGATDALTGVLWKDDAQLVVILGAKYYTSTAEEAPRAEFGLMEYNADAHLDLVHRRRGGGVLSRLHGGGHVNGRRDWLDPQG